VTHLALKQLVVVTELVLKKKQVQLQWLSL
jgi:hypothetical protein